MSAEETKQGGIASAKEEKSTIQKSWKKREKIVTSAKNDTGVIWGKRQR